jgi:anti-anti-sigma factor
VEKLLSTSLSNPVSERFCWKTKAWVKAQAAALAASKRTRGPRSVCVRTPSPRLTRAISAGNCYIRPNPGRAAVVSIRVTNSKVEPDIVLLHLAGHLSVSQETDNLEWQLRSLLRQGERKLIFDLAGVDQIDADAALVLVRCFFAARGSGGELRFAAARPSVVRPFTQTTLDSILPFDATVDISCEYFRGRLKMHA